MDDNTNCKTRITALTGVLVPASRYAELRDQLYRDLPWFLTEQPEIEIWDESGGEPAEIIPAWTTKSAGKRSDEWMAEWTTVLPPELHASDLYKEHGLVDDGVRLAALESVVDFVLNNDLSVYRVGVIPPRDRCARRYTDNELHRQCWLKMLLALQPVLDTQQVIPIMDGLNLGRARALSAVIRNFDIFRASGIGGNADENPCLARLSNILGEMYFANSEHSVFVQVADVVSYLRTVTDWANHQFDLQRYKAQLLPLAKQLQPVMKKEETVQL